MSEQASPSSGPGMIPDPQQLDMPENMRDAEGLLAAAMMRAAEVNAVTAVVCLLGESSDGSNRCVVELMAPSSAGHQSLAALFGMLAEQHAEAAAHEAQAEKAMTEPTQQ